MAGLSLTNIVTFALRVKDGQLAARELDRFADSSEKAARKASEANDAIAASYRRTGARMLASGTLILTGFAKAAQATESLAKAQQLTDTIFGNASAAIDAYAENSIDKLGLSERAYRESAGQIGSIIKGLGFETREAADITNRVLEIGADRAAAFGRTTGDALNAITGIFRNEFDTIERFGVSINQSGINARIQALGLDTSTAALKRNAEAVAALDLLTEQTADTTGFFNSEANEAAAAQQKMRAEIENAVATLGEDALPILREAIGALTDLVGAFNDLPGPVKETITRFGLLVGAFNIVGGSILTAAGNIKRLRDGLKTLGATASRSVGLFSGVGLALGTAVQLWGQSADRAERAAKNAERAADVIAQANEDASRFRTSGDIFRTFLSEEEFAGIVRAMDEVGVTVDSLDRAFALSEGNLRTFTQLLGSAFNVELAKTDDFEKLTELFNAVGDGFDLQAARVATGVIKDSGLAIDELGNFATEAAEDLPDFTENFKVIASEGKPAAEVLAGLNREMSEFIDNLFFDDTEAEFFAALRNLGELVNSEDFDGIFDPNASDEAFEIAKAIEEIVTLAADLTIAEAIGENLTDEQAAAYFDGLVAQMLETLGLGDQLNEKIDGLQANLDETRDQVLVELALAGQGEFERDLARWLATVQGRNQLFITPAFPSGAITPSSPRFVPDTGGNSLNGPTPALVGPTPQAEQRSGTGPSSGTAISRGGGASAQPIILEVDGRQLGTVVVDALNSTGGAPLEIRGQR